MSQLELILTEQAQPQAQELLNGIKSKLGKIPNIFAIMGHSNVALKAFLDFKAALSKSELNNKEPEVVALVAAQLNNCEYCLCAHTATSKMAGLSEEEILEVRKGKSSDPKTQALINLVTEIVKRCGNPSDATIDAFLAAGYSKGALVDVIAWYSLNLYTNYFNHIAKTPVDFPKVEKIENKKCCCS